MILSLSCGDGKSENVPFFFFFSVFSLVHHLTSSFNGSEYYLC